MQQEILNLSIKELSEKHNCIYRTLIKSLNTGNSWRQLLSTLSSYRIVIAMEQIHKMELSDNPSAILLQELQNRCAKISHLQIILRESNLLNSLSLISEPEPLRITLQPGEEGECVVVEPTSTLNLKCVVEGLPPPTYQWYRGNISLCNQTTSTLVISNFSEKECGEYYCTAYHTVEGERKEIGSNCITAELLPLAPHFMINLPRVVTVDVGDDVTLHIEVNARPEPTYSWVLDNTVLNKQTTDTLQLDDIQESDQGRYHCLVRNKAGDIVSEICEVIVNDIPRESVYENIASSKVALLIANKTYETLDNLNTPINDVALISKKLSKLGFHVISLQNLTLVEMTNTINWFCRIIPVNAYVLFYFVGHGFKLNSKYMMPVDCPHYESFAVTDCYSEEMLIEKVMGTKAQLLVTIFDMCLKTPVSDNLRGSEPVIKFDRKKEFNLIQCFSTSSHMEAFEKASDVIGIYAKHLVKFLNLDLPITSVLQLVIEEFARCEECDQKPFLNFDDPVRRKFTDPVQGDDQLDREVESLYALPEAIELHFPIVGEKALVKLSFYMDCIVNALVFTFPVNLNAWCISVEVNPEEVNKQWTLSENGENILTLFDLQKSKSSISITIQLKIKNESGNVWDIVDCCQLDLACIEIVRKCLWFDDKVSS